MNETETPDDAPELAEDAADDSVDALAPEPEATPVDAASTPAEHEAVDPSSSAFMGVPIEILISVGKARPRVSELVKLRRDSVISLDSKLEDPVEIYVGDRLIARGELQEMEDTDGQLGVRLTEVADLSNGV